MVMRLGFELGDFINLFHFAINLERAPTNPFLDQYIRISYIHPFLASYPLAEEAYMATVSLKFSLLSVEDSTFC